jgi:hypothetical protein
VAVIRGEDPPITPVVMQPGAVDDASAPENPPRATVPSLTLSGLTRAMGVTDRALEQYQPPDDVLRVGEGFLAGHSGHRAIAVYAGLTEDRVKAVLNDALAMQWISRRTEVLFRSRAAVIDTALYLRAASGDIRAIELFYKRMKLLEESTKKVDIHYSGGVNLTSLSDKDLQQLVREKARTLPADFRVLESKVVEDKPEPPAEPS